MINRNSKLTAVTAVLFEIIIIISAAFSITSKQWYYLLLLFLTAVCIIIPFIITIIADKKNIMLPFSFQLISVLFIILAMYFGEIKKFYFTIWWWDLLLHAVSGSYAVLIALYLMKGIMVKEKDVTVKRFTVLTIIFAFSFSIALGTLWEMLEFTADYLFKTAMVKGGLEDTSTDLIVKILAAFITSVICYYRKPRYINNRKD